MKQKNLDPIAEAKACTESRSIIGEDDCADKSEGNHECKMRTDDEQMPTDEQLMQTDEREKRKNKDRPMR